MPKHLSVEVGSESMTTILRDANGRFKRGNKGFWLGKKRPNLNNINKVVIEHELLRALYLGNGFSPMEIADLFRCARNVIRLKLKRYNIPMRNGSKAQLERKYKGLVHWNWKGGITTKNLKIRNSIEYTNWRLIVFRRDNYACQLCNASNCFVIAHHIYKFSKYPNERLDVNNGITLCKICHETVVNQHEDEWIDCFLSILNGGD